MTFEEIKKLIKQFDDSSLNELIYETEEISLTLKKSGDPHPIYTQPIMVHPQSPAGQMSLGGFATAPAPSGAAPAGPAQGTPAGGSPGGTDAATAPPQPDTAAASDIEVITSPIVGTFYRSPSPDSPSFCQEGDVVEKGKTLCILEAMKVMNELEAEFTMEVVAFKVNNGDMVEYGTPILEVRRV
jgi:acetyl-CoA carboxylase biotin carboxyl carrier protein